MYYNATCKEWAEGLVYGFGRKSGGKHARKCSKQERTFGNEGEGEQGPLIGKETFKINHLKSSYFLLILLFSYKMGRESCKGVLLI